MTKKELLENTIFSQLPDDAEIVFATSPDIGHCVPLNALNISSRNSMSRGVEMVIDAIPYWFLKEQYHITIVSEGYEEQS